MIGWIKCKLDYHDWRSRRADSQYVYCNNCNRLGRIVEDN